MVWAKSTDRPMSQPCLYHHFTSTCSAIHTPVHLVLPDLTRTSSSLAYNPCITPTYPLWPTLPLHSRFEMTQNRAATNADEIAQLYQQVLKTAGPWLKSADDDVLADPATIAADQSRKRPAIVHSQTAEQLNKVLDLNIGEQGVEDMSDLIDKIFENSVNTTSPGFMDKLYSSPSPPGLAADLMLSILNTNSHVFTVSPALTVVEKYTGKRLANQFGLMEDVSGGVSLPGGAMSNLTALLVARNIMFPQVITDGVGSLSKPLAMFTSDASHYSMIAAAQNLGLGGKSVRKVASVDDAMDPEALDREMQKAVDEGHVPFYVGATAGTTVRGAYDDLRAIAAVAKKYGAWFHVDACWGGGAIFSPTHKHKLDGSELADTIAFNPHKMLGVPLTSSFLLGRDLRTFWTANRLEAGYLFHGDAELAQSDATSDAKAGSNGQLEEGEDWRTSARIMNAPHPDKVVDMAQFTTQCGRRPDAIKLYAHWRYYGTEGIAQHIDTAFEGAKILLDLVRRSESLSAVEAGDPPCAQACFYYAGTKGNLGPEKRITREIVDRLVDYGWMTDFAPGKTKQEEYLRVVCNRLTTEQIIINLVKAVELVGRQVEAEWDL